MPRADKLKRWNPPEIIDVLKYINDNFDMWFENHLSTCAKLIAAVKLDGRDAKSVYNKVRTLIKPMEEYLKTKKKSNPRDIIWENKKIFNLLKEICLKSKKKERGEKDDNLEETIKVENTDQATTNASTSQMDVDDVIDLETVNDLDNLGNLDTLDTLDTLKENFNANFKEIHDLKVQINQRRTELKGMETELKEKKDKLNVDFKNFLSSND